MYGSHPGYVLEPSVKISFSQQGPFDPLSPNIAGLVVTVQRLFAPRYFQSLERKFPVGTFAPKNESSQELSFQGANIQGNIRSAAIYRGANCTSNYKLHITHKPTLKPIYTEDGVYSLEFESTGHCSK